MSPLYVHAGIVPYMRESTAQPLGTLFATAQNSSSYSSTRADAAAGATPAAPTAVRAIHTDLAAARTHAAGASTAWFRTLGQGFRL
jgi:hypothetical protein